MRQHSTKPPRTKFISDGPTESGYRVMLGDDRIGWVRKHGALWIATDTFMRDAGTHHTRDYAAARLRVVFREAVAKGEI